LIEEYIVYKKLWNPKYSGRGHNKHFLNNHMKGGECFGSQKSEKESSEKSGEKKEKINS